MSISSHSLETLPGHAGFAGGNYLDWLGRGEFDPDAPAIMGIDGSDLTHRELHQLIFDCGEEILSKGLGRGSVVLLGIPNGPNALTALLAFSNVVTTVLVSPEEPESSIQRLLDQLPVSAFVFEESRPGVLGRIASRQKHPSLRLLEGSGKNGHWEFSTFNLPDLPKAEPINDDDAAILVRTAGTMGKEKLVAWSQTSVAVSADTAAEWMNLSEKDRSLCVMPFSHLHSFVRSSLPVLLRGGLVVCAPGFDKTKVLDWIEAVEPTFITGSPAIFRTLVDRVNLESRNPKTFALRFLASGSDKIDKESVDSIASVFSVPVREFYGMSEVSPMLAASPPDELAQRNHCVGQVMAPWTLSIRDTDGSEDSSRTSGEIVARGGMINPSLPADPPLSPEPRYYHTGDVGCLVDGDRLQVLGRVDNRINRGGKKISPEQVETVLRAHPAVQDVAIFPYPDQVLNERVGAAIVLRPGCEFDAAQARGVVGRILPDYMAPEQVIFLESLPVNRAGKVIRSELVDEVNKRQKRVKKERCKPNSATEERLAGFFAKALESDDFSLEEDFTVLGGDSFQATMMLIEIEEHFGILLTPADFMENGSVKALGKLLDARTSANASSFGDPELNKFSEDPPHLSTLLPGDQSCPLVLAHAVSGYANYAASFARAFSENQTLVSLSWKEGLEGPVESLELYAASLVAEIVGRFPSGPLAIAGHSFGAQLAYEIAQQLSDLDREPALLIVIDDEADLYKRQFGVRQKSLPQEIYACCCHWLYSYVPKPYSGAVLLVQAEDQIDDILPDSFCGWRDLAPRIKRLVVPGDHHSMMGEKWIARWAGMLEESIRGAIQGDFDVPETNLPVLAPELTRARTSSKEGNLHQEIAAYETALQNGGAPFFWVYRNLAEACWQAGRREAALQAYQEAISREEVPLTGAALLARRLLETGDVRKAWRVAEDAVQACPPDNAPGKVACGQIYELFGKPREAVGCYREALAIQKNQRMAQTHLARILMTFGDHQEALSFLDQLCDRPGVSYNVFARRAICFCRVNPADEQRQNIIGEATARVAQSIKSESNFVQDYLMLALLRALVPDRNGADEALQRALHMLPSARDRSEVMCKIGAKLDRGPLRVGSFVLSALHHLRHFRSVRLLLLHSLEKQVIGSGS